MNIQSIQDSIVSKLDQAFTDAALPFLSRRMPDTSMQYEMALKNPIAYVVYAGSSAQPSMSTDIIAQSRKIRFNIECHSRLLYDVSGDMGMYALRDVVEQVLIGFTPDNAQRLYLLQDDISQTDDKIWVHVFQFECETMLIQKEQSDPIIVPSYQETIYKE
jgi:hypothetical protein